ENNKALEKESSTQDTADVIRERDFLFQAIARQEEEHFRTLDSLIRQQQATRRESVKYSPVLRFKKRFT
ncbi:MerR family transcriptional regulator, partial [Mediterraneibacter faecis]|nr:MerR family transcriptional regulator [Mediterraneibacter faecis]